MTRAPQWLVDAMPEGPLRDFVQGWGWYVLLGVGGFIVLLLLWTVMRSLTAGTKRVPGPARSLHLEENLADYPQAPPRTGDQRLLAEGTPVRLRLVVIAPAGSESEDSLDTANLERVLDRVLPGLGAIFKEDKPRVREWGQQVSYQGFATHFFRNMLTGDEEGELSRWVLVAGRVKLKGFQVMLGLALQAVKPTTIGQRTVDAHEWTSVLRVRTRD